jgi:L,D-transpeptidase YcbB
MRYSLSYRIGRYVDVIVACLIISGCSLKTSFDIENTKSSNYAIELLLDSTLVKDYHLRAPASVREVYNKRKYEPIWIAGDSINPAADSLLHVVRNASYYGLNPLEYHWDLLSEILAKDRDAMSASTLDVLLTDAFFALYAELGKGRLEKHILTRRPVVHRDTSAIALLPRMVEKNSAKQILEQQEPVNNEYLFLKQVLAEKLNKLPTHKNNSFVRLTEDFPSDEINTIIVNMERWRWEAYPLPDRYVNVNIPLFELQVINCDSVAFTSRVVVGAPVTPTPVIESVIECFTIYPYWHVPRKIAVNELLPIIQTDTSYISRNNFDVLDKKGNITDHRKIDWRKLNHDYFPYVLRQRDGEENSLGIIKFRFDNPFAVYLHDTNAKRYFNQGGRALSHGCVRVEKAIALARHLIRDDPNCTAEDLDSYLTLRQRRDIDLTSPIPIRIKYFTYKREGQQITFLDDVYGLDSLMKKHLSISHHPQVRAILN